MATDKNFVVKNGLEVGGVLIVNSSGQLEVTTVVSDLHFQDNIKAKFGLGSDLQIYHDGTDSNIINFTGDLVLRNGATDKDIIFQSDDGSGSETTYFLLDGSNAKTQFNRHLKIIDNMQIQVGTGPDMLLYHDGTHSHIDNNQGSLYISSSNTVQIENSSGNDMITAQSGGAVTLFYNAFSKLATTSTGIDVTGNIVADGGTIDGTFIVDGGTGVSSTGVLHVRQNGDGDGNGIAITSSNATSHRIWKDSSGNLNIGSSSDSDAFKQDLSGNITIAGEIYAKDSNSTTDPTYTFTGHTTTGMSVTNSGSQDELHFITGGTRRMHLNDAGVTSFANVYTGTTGTFRNYGGTWQGTTGTSGNGFKFVNTADSVTPLNVTSSGQLTLTNQSTTTYMTHLSNGMLRNTSSNGYIEIGPANTAHAHIQTDLSNFYFNKELRVDTGVIGSYNEDLYLRRASNSQGQLQLTEHKLAASAPSKSNQLVLGGFVAEASLENSRHFYHPGLQSNALAGLHDRGTVTATKNGSAISLGEDPFVAGSGHADITVAAGTTDTVVITLSGFTGLSYSSSAGIVFGNDSFRALDVEIETSTDGGSTWTSRLDVTNQAATTVVADFSSGGTATNAIRYTLTNFNTTNCRVLNLFAYKYNTSDQYFPEMYRDSTMYADLTFRDNKYLKFGNGGDLQLYHDGTDSLIRNYTNDFIIQNDANDKDIIIRTDDGSGGVTPYMTFDGSDTLTRAYKTIVFQDNVKASFGNSEDMRIKHDGSNGSIDNYTGDLLFRNNVDDKDIILQSDNGSGGLADYIRLDGSDTSVRISQHMKLPDSKALYFGDGEDFNIWHSGTNSLIDHIGTGNLYLRNTTNDKDILIQTDDGAGGLSTYAMADGSDGTFKLYHYGSLKLNTKSDGVDITGELQSDSLDVDGNADISGNLVLGGNLTVSGTTTTVSTTNTAITDALIELGSGNTGTNSNDLGLILERGTSGNNAFIGFDESDDQIALALTTATGSSTGNLAFSSYLNLRAGNINVGQITNSGLIDNNYTGTGIHTLQNSTSNGTVLTLTTTGDSRVLTFQSDHIFSNGALYLGSNSYSTNYRGSAHNFDTGDLTIPNKIIHSGDTDTYLHFAAADDFRIVVGNSTRAAFNTSKIHFNQEGINQDFQVQGDTDTELLYVDASEDKVGIGTSAPTQALSVDGILHSDINENYYGAWLSGNSASSQDSSLGLGPWWNNAGYVKFIQSGTPHRLSIYTHLTGDHLTLQEAGGNVGIGVTDPDAKLEVNGTTKLGTSSYSASVDTITDGALIIPQPARIISQASTGDYLRTIFTHETSNGHYVFGQQGTSLIGDMIFYPGSSGNIRFYASGSEDIRFDTNGRIGVGTTSPGKPIDVVGDIRAKDSSDNQHQLRADKVISYGTDAILQAQSAGDDVRLNTENNVTRLIATAEGTVGIGTTSPTHKLHVSGMTKLNAIVHKSGNLVITTGSGDNYIGTIETSGNGDSSGATLTIYDGQHKTTRIVYLAIQNASGTNSLNYSVSGGGGEADIDIQLKYINRSGTADKTDFYLASSSGKSYTQVYSWEAEGLIEDTGHSSTGASSIDLDDQMGIMTLSNGNVGIGTPSTQQNGRLHVNGNFRVGPYYSADDRDGFLLIPHGTDTRLQSNNERFHIENGSGDIIVSAGGNVGIGTTSPDKALTISASDSQVRLYDADGTNQFASFQSDSGIAKITSRNNTSHGQIAFQRYNGTVVTESMRINSSGNVGIGTSSPSYMLDVGGGDFFVNGTNRDWGGTGGLGTHIGTGDFDIYSGVPGSGSHLLAVTNAGQVGIGTESPSTMLHIKSAAPNIRLEDSDNTSYGEIIYNTAAGGLIIRSDENAATGTSGSNIIFETDGSEKVRILSNGNTIFGGTSVGAAGAMSVKIDGTYTDLYLYGAGTSQGGRIFFGDSSDRSSIEGTYGTGGGGKLTFKTDTTGGTSQNRLVIDSDGSITFNNAFTFPSSDGSANQVLITNGSGTVTWGDVSASNADTVDNLHATSFIRSDANDDFTGTLNYTPDTGTILALDGGAAIQRHTANGALSIGKDDALILGAGEAINALRSNITMANEFVYIGAEGGVTMYAFPNNDTTWSNRKTFSFDGTNGLNLESVFTVDINGNLSATTKSFDIEHPTKEGMRLHHGVLEGPEHAVYIRGKSNSYIIELPDYWEGLVYEDTITVQLTPIGGQNDMWIENIEDNKVYINCEREMKQYFYFIQAERKDIERFEVEYEV